jgi:hypothetical protein
VSRVVANEVSVEKNNSNFKTSDKLTTRFVGPVTEQDDMVTNNDSESDSESTRITSDVARTAVVAICGLDRMFLSLKMVGAVKSD